MKPKACFGTCVGLPIARNRISKSQLTNGCKWLGRYYFSVLGIVLAFQLVGGQGSTAAERNIVSHIVLEGNLLGMNFASQHQSCPGSGQSTGASCAISTVDSCDVRQEELSVLEDALLQATNELTLSANQTVKPNEPASSCSSLITFIKNQGRYISAQIKLLKTEEMRDLHMYSVVKSELSSQLTEFNKMVDNFKKTHLEQQSNLTNSFNTKLAAYQKQVNDLYLQIDDLRAEAKENAIHLCVANIKGDEPDMALEEWTNLNDTDNALLLRITKEAYGGNPENVQKIVSFAQRLPTCAQDIVLYPTLFQEMRRYGHLNSPEILVVQEGTKGCANILSNFTNALSAHVDNVIAAWAAKVRARDNYQINEFAKKYLYTDIFYDRVPKLIETIYSGNTANFPAVLHFIFRLPSYAETRVGFESLFEELKKHGQLYTYEAVRFAYKLKETMTLRNFQTLSDTVKGKYDTLKNSLPRNVVNLVWDGQSCSIKNSRYSEYLSTSSSYTFFDAGSHKAFTDGGYDSCWNFETEDEGVSFAIKNQCYGEYLFVTDSVAKDANRRWTVTFETSKPSRLSFWKLKPFDDELFTVVSNPLNEYLYAEGDMSHGPGGNKRGVFTWRSGTPQGSRFEQSKWRISC